MSLESLNGLCLVLLLIALLAGCAVQPVPEPETFFHFSSLRVAEPVLEENQEPQLPPRPTGVALSENGVAYLAFPKEQAVDLLHWVEVAEANTRTGQQLARWADAATAERNRLIELGKVVEQRNRDWARRWAETETARRQLERELWWDSLLTRSLLLVGVIVVAL